MLTEHQEIGSAPAPRLPRIAPRSSEALVNVGERLQHAYPMANETDSNHEVMLEKREHVRVTVVSGRL